MNRKISFPFKAGIYSGIFFLLSSQLFAQDITGLWKGTISTADKQLAYELAITGSDGDFTGYSYTTFDVKGVEMVAVKSIRVKKENNTITISDEDLIYDSFKDAAAKQVKQTDNLVLKTDGGLMTLTGKFRTKQTRQFRSLTGDISVQKQEDFSNTKLLPALDSLNLKAALSFLQPKSIPATVTIASKIILKPDTTRDIAKTSTPVLQQAKEKKIVAIPVEEVKPAPPVAAKPVQVPVRSAPVATNNPVKKTPPPVVKQIPKAPVVSPPVATAPAPIKAPVVAVPVKKLVPDFTAELAKRSIETIQTVYFKTDSLQITLYDNGEVDGDTVSVILNGRMIMAKQGLSTRAITKTIYLTPDMGDSLQLVMYAENLGSLPPNTGLLIINDGRDRYEIRFAGDLTKNAAIILRRRKL